MIHYYDSNKTNRLKKQYADAGNFNRRVELVRRFSSNKRSFTAWVFDHMKFPKNARVLELGCGPGYLWRGNAGRLPSDASITLSDFSEGMLESAKTGLAACSRVFDFVVVDAQQIPFSDDEFDIVVANHMLYHVPDRKRALSEIRRVLKPGGTLYATTVGLHDLCEIRELFRCCFFLPSFPVATVANAFGLENGYTQLSNFFENIRLEKYVNHLEVTEAQPVIDYLLSAGSSRLESFMTPERRSCFKDYLESIIESNGYIYVTKASGLFIARYVKKKKNIGIYIHLKAPKRIHPINTSLKLCPNVISFNAKTCGIVVFQSHLKRIESNTSTISTNKIAFGIR